MVVVVSEGDELIITLRSWDRALVGCRSARALLAASTLVESAPELLGVRPRSDCHYQYLRAPLAVGTWLTLRLALSAPSGATRRSRDA